MFTEDQEKELESYILRMESKLFGLTPYDIRCIAYQLASRLGISHKFNTATEMAGQDWFRAFMKRHPELSLRKPEATSAARAHGFNKVAVSKFFKVAGEVMEKYHFPASRIFNCDETGITVVPKSMGNIVSLRGKKQVGYMTSAERGELVTAEICCSAAGQYMSPLLIFPRKKPNPEFEEGKPEGAWAEYHPSGWMQAEIFTRWMDKFIAFTRASEENPVLLFLDGHSTHTKNLDVLQKAVDNGVVMVSLPPHTSHRMQPLDLSFMKPLSSYMTGEINKALRGLGGKALSIKKIFPIFGKAFAKAATMESAQNGFRKAGLWPFNPDIFTDADFKSSENSGYDSEDEASAETEAIGSEQNSMDVVVESELSAANVESSETIPRFESEISISSEEKSPDNSANTQSQFLKTLRNIKQEFSVRMRAQKNQSSKAQSLVVEEVDLTISDVIPPGAVPISSVATSADEAISVDLCQERCGAESLPSTSFADPHFCSTPTTLSRKRASAKVAGRIPAKKNRKGMSTELTSPQYMQQLREDKEAAVAKKEAVAAKKAATAAKKAAGAAAKKNKDPTKAELEQMLLQQQAINAHISRFSTPSVNENVAPVLLAQSETPINLSNTRSPFCGLTPSPISQPWPFLP